MAAEHWGVVTYTYAKYQRTAICTQRSQGDRRGYTGFKSHLRCVSTLFWLFGLMYIRIRAPFLVFALALLTVCAEAKELQETPLGPSIIGIDHIPVAVKNLDQATNAYQKLGFSLKPGQLHKNGIRNNHVKFKDGSGLELLSPPSNSKDAQTSYYLDHLKQGDGPAYISFHARDIDKLIAALNASGFEFKNDGAITLNDPKLGFIFFVKDNRSPSDKPKHFAHPNSAIAMTAVWLALDDETCNSLTRLLTVLGAVTSQKTVFAPNAVKARVFNVQNGQVIVLPRSHQLHIDRAVVGATFRIWSDSSVSHVSGGNRKLLVPPSTARGLWLDLREGL